jgi:hypothetical protein
MTTRHVIRIQTDTQDNKTFVRVAPKPKGGYHTTTPNGMWLHWDKDGNLWGMDLPGLPHTVVVDDTTNRRHDWRQGN